MSTQWSKTTRYIVSIGLAIFGIYLIYLSRPVVTLVIIAALISFLLMPLVNFFNNRFRMPRGLAVLFAYLVGIIILLLAPLIFIPPIIEGFNYLAQIDYQILVNDTMQWSERTLLSLKEIDLKSRGINLNLSLIVDPALASLQSAEAEFTPSLPPLETLIRSARSAVTVTYGVATNLAGTVFSGALTFIVLFLSAIYMSLDAHKFSDRFLAIVPATQQAEMSILLKRLGKTWRAYFRGQLNLMLIIGFVTWVGLSILGLPGAFVLAVIAGFMELVPNLGPFLAAIPAVIVALLQGSTHLAVSNWVFVLIIIGFYVLVQQFENTFVVPRILGEAVNLHPLVVMLGVLIGANVGGILGALLAAPIIASIREIVRYLYCKILGENPYPPSQDETQEQESALWQQSRFVYQKLQMRLASAVKGESIEEETPEPITTSPQQSVPNQGDAQDQ